MKTFLAAIQFLTVIPVPARYYCDEKELARSVIYFPLIGMLIGALMAALDWALGLVLPPLPVSVLVVMAMMGITGCLHMDGVADTADGFLSARPKERILEIMRDSRIGAMGGIALVCVILLKVSALASVPQALRAPTLVLMGLGGEVALLVVMTLLPYARTGSGMAAFSRNNSIVPLIAGAILYGAVAWFSVGWLGVAMSGVVLTVTLLFAWWCSRKIGGYTGDTLGMTGELAAICIALVAAAWGKGF
jgi:adenosylcobinamide-GDP ribazoletransferase